MGDGVEVKDHVTDLMIRCIAVPDTQNILIETNAKHGTTYVITEIKLVPH